VRVVVTGGREFLDEDFMFEALDWLHDKEGPITELAHGGQKAWMPLTSRWRGADYYAGKWAKMRGIAHRDFPVTEEEWRRLHKAAGPIRNRRMLDEFRPDRVYAFPGGKGTRDCVRAALDRSLTVFSVRLDDRMLVFTPIADLKQL
jgi:hypothetical protein